MLLTRCLVLLALLGLGACASQRGGVGVPPEALTVATVRHTAGPQPQAAWIERAALPADAQRSDGERALLLEASLSEGRVVALEPAPLELANLIVRVESRDRRQTVIAVQNGSSAVLAYDLFVSPDGERFRIIPSCPAQPHASAYERWPERAAWIAVANVRAVEATPPDCE